MKGSRRPLSLHISRAKNEGPLLSEKLCVTDCRTPGKVEGKGKSVVLGAKRKGEKNYGNDCAVMLGLSGVLTGLLALAVPAASEGVTVGTKLDFYFCQPRREGLVYFQRGHERTRGSYCEETMELLAGALVRG